MYHSPIRTLEAAFRPGIRPDVAILVPDGIKRS
jgi:hypothetical protein